MSTSKIGRTIKTRDVVTPGYSNSKKKDTLKDLREELVEVKKLCNSVVEKYKNQQAKIINFNNKIDKLEEEESIKNHKLKLAHEELKQKNFRLGEISQKVSNLENKISELKNQCDDLKEKLESRKCKDSTWSLFRSGKDGS